MMHIDTHKAFTKLVEAGLKKEAAEGIIGAGGLSLRRQFINATIRKHEISVL